MALTITDSTQEARSWSVGPVKLQVVTYSVASGDTSGTVTADKLKDVFHIIPDGSLQFTAAATFSGNVATLAFADPGATRYGTMLLIGR